MTVQVAGNMPIARELARTPTKSGDLSNFNAPTIASIRTMHDAPPVEAPITLADGVFVIAFYDADGQPLLRITERELPLPNGDPRAPEGAVEARWQLFKSGYENSPERRMIPERRDPVVTDVDLFGEYEMPEVVPLRPYRVRIANEDPDTVYMVTFQRRTNNPDDGLPDVVCCGGEHIGGSIVVRDGTVVVPPPGAERLSRWLLDKTTLAKSLRPSTLAECEDALARNFPGIRLSRSASVYD